MTRTTMERIGPEGAAELLKLPLPGPHLHPVQRLVDRLARDMADENWCEQYTDPIDVTDLILKNGMHRLLAVIKSGTYQWFAVTR